MPPEEVGASPQELQWLSEFMAAQTAQLAQTSGAKAAHDFTKAMGGAAPEIQQAWLEAEPSAVDAAASLAAGPVGGEAASAAVTGAQGSGEAAQYAAASAAEWDENWEMFWRFGPAGVYEYAHANTPFAESSGNSGNWMTLEAAEASYNTLKAAQAAPLSAAGAAQERERPPAAEAQSAQPTPEHVGEISAEQEAAAETVYEAIVKPAVTEVVSKLRAELPAELVAKIGSDMERLVEELVVASTSRELAESAGQN